MQIKSHFLFLFCGITQATPNFAQTRSKIASELQASAFLELQMQHLPPEPESKLSAAELRPLLAEKNVLEREELALAIFERGHFPNLLRDLKQVSISERGHQVSFWVMPDYLAIGSDDDHILMPLNFISTRRLLNAWGFALPTRKMVDAIYRVAERTIWPKTFPPGPEMNSMESIDKHNQWIKGQRYLFPNQSVLTAGHKKDIVLSSRLYRRDDRIAIYGWHNIRNGEPIQPLSIWHGEQYVDYSHGVRAVAPWVLVDGKLMLFKELLLHPQLASLLSDEGPIDVDRVMQNYPYSVARN